MKNEENNQFIKEYIATGEIPKKLTSAASLLLPDGRDFWRFFSGVYSQAKPILKRKMTWQVKKYEKEQERSPA